MFNFKKIFISAFVFLTGANLVLGYVAESPSYRMEKDSINFAGSDFSASANYGLGDTLGEIGSGGLTGALYGVKAGYRAAVGDYTISISAPANISLSPSLTTSGSSAGGNGSWTVTTDNPGGYLLYIRAETDPALQSSVDSFDDYTPVSAGTPDFVWSVDSNASEFGFTVLGADTRLVFRDDGSACNIGSNLGADRCWFGLSTGDYLIASKNSPNSPMGVTTSVNFKAEIGAQKNQTAGSYVADITLTALTQ